MKTPTWLFIACCILTALPACQISETEPETEADTSSRNITLEYIRSLGFPLETIEEHDDMYLVESDIIFSKKDTDNLSQPRHAYNSLGLVNYFAISNVSITVDSSIPTSGADDWRIEIQQAINDWNSIGGSRLHFSYTTNSSANVVIRSDAGSLSDNTIAAAEFPSSGLSGFQIRINLDFQNDLSVPSAQKRYNMVHELGHIIGLRHTNWQGRGETSTISIPGTPCTDNNSVMNGGTADFSWNGFSDYDIVAGRVLYPIDRPAGTFYFLRYYQQSTGDHFYTIFYGELGCGAGGYVAEGIEGFIFQNQATGTVPVYRYRSDTYGDHFYTLVSGSYNTYVSEGISGYAYNTQIPGTVPIYVYYNQALQDHFYTRFNATYSGYVLQGVAWHAIP